MNLHLEHIALSVANLEKSISFYHELLGCEIMERIACPAESRLGEIVGLPHCSATIVKLRSGAVVLELFAYHIPQGKALPPSRSQADHGWTHLGFASEDIHADYQRLTRGGVKFYSPPIEYRPGVWNAYFYGPDGETCELRQALPTKA